MTRKMLRVLGAALMSALMLGSTAIPGAPECNIVLASDEDDGQRTIKSENRIPEFLGGATFSGERLNFDKETGYVWLSRAETKEEKKHLKELAVLFRMVQELMQNPQGLSKNTLKTGKGINESKVADLIDKGLNGIMFWQLTEDTYTDGLLDEIDKVRSSYSRK